MRIVIGGTAAVAVSLLPGWATYLRSQKGWDCKFLLTRSATAFVSQQALQSISGNKVAVDNDYLLSGDPLHKNLTAWADVVSIVPCTYNSLMKLASGISDNVVLTTAYFFEGPKLVFPCFDSFLLESLGVQNAIGSLRENGWTVPQISNQGMEVAGGISIENHGFPMINEFIECVETVTGH